MRRAAALQAPIGPGRQQVGVGLIELMIALLIGLLVSMAALGSLAHARLTAITQAEAARLHQDASVALQLIESQVRQAGGRSLHDTPGGRVALLEAPLDDLRKGAPKTAEQAPRAVDGLQGADGKPDVLRIGRDADAGIDARDCLGHPPAPGRRILSRFEWVEGNLRCKGSGRDEPAPLIEGVEDFQVRYAVRLGERLQYQEAPADWSQVQGVWVCLRLVGPAGRTARGEALRGCRDEPLADDGRMRRVFTRAIQIRRVASLP